jgi:hypothetical protein
MLYGKKLMRLSSLYCQRHPQVRWIPKMNYSSVAGLKGMSLHGIATDSLSALNLSEEALNLFLLKSAMRWEICAHQCQCNLYKHFSLWYSFRYSRIISLLPLCNRNNRVKKSSVAS